jgi:hypothetical protein
MLPADFGECRLRGLNPISGSHRNAGFRMHSGPSPGDSGRRAFRPKRKFRAPNSSRIYLPSPAWSTLARDLAMAKNEMTLRHLVVI